MIGRKVNLSPFVVLVALSFWSGLLGCARGDPRRAADLDAWRSSSPRSNKPAPWPCCSQTMSANSNAGPCSRRVSPAVSVEKTEARPRVTIFACALVLASVPI